jgi:putative addiction module component (TIGR02574 family)
MIQINEILALDNNNNKIELAELIWDNIDINNFHELTDDMKTLINERLADYENSSSLGSSWQDVYSRLK